MLVKFGVNDVQEVAGVYVTLVGPPTVTVIVHAVSPSQSLGLQLADGPACQPTVALVPLAVLAPYVMFLEAGAV